MPPVTRVQAKKQALAGPLRVGIEGSLGAWYGGIRTIAYLF